MITKNNASLREKNPALANEPLEDTSERVRPDDPTTEYWFKRNLAGYHLALPRIKPTDRVLDLGSGEGYGLALVQKKARACMGVDSSFEVIQHAVRKYGERLFVGDVSRIGLAASSMDVVLSLQVIEHLSVVDEYLSEIRRVLKPGGWAWLSTPNRLTFVGSPFHVQEFTAQELRAKISPIFPDHQIWGIKIKPGRNHYYQAALAQSPANDYWVNSQMNVTAARMPATMHKLVPGPLRKLTRLVLRTWLTTRPLRVNDFYLDDTDLDQSLDLVVCGVASPGFERG